MFPSGIFVRTELSDLISSLPDRLIRTGPPRLTLEVEPVDPGTEDQTALEIRQWSDEWCLIQGKGPEELITLVIESLVHRGQVGEVLSCNFRPEACEYSYAYYRDGMLLETFECRGPSIETVNFTSELRKVPLLTLLKASDFMIGSVGHFGITPGPVSENRSGKVVIHINIPAKRSFWQALLGAVLSK